MSDAPGLFDVDEQEVGRQRIAELRDVLDGRRPPAPSPDAQRSEREQSIDQIAESSAGWRNDTALPFIRRYLETHPTLFVDDLWAAGLPEPHDRKALGPALRDAARRQWMVQSGDHRISAQNANPKPVWRSLLHEAPFQGDTHE